LMLHISPLLPLFFERCLIGARYYIFRA